MSSFSLLVLFKHCSSIVPAVSQQDSHGTVHYGKNAKQDCVLSRGMSTGHKKDTKRTHFFVGRHIFCVIFVAFHIFCVIFVPSYGPKISKLRIPCASCVGSQAQLWLLFKLECNGKLEFNDRQASWGGSDPVSLGRLRVDLGMKLWPMLGIYQLQKTSSLHWKCCCCPKNVTLC